MDKIKVIVNGCLGKMGREVVKAISKESDLALVGGVDMQNTGTDIGEAAGIGKLNVKVTSDLGQTIKNTGADVVVDFTIPKSVMSAITIIAENKAHAVVGTTGLTEENLKEIDALCKKNKVNTLVAPNFAIGAVLMMKFATEAARHMPKAEIIELHHDQKLDAPSGTSIKTAEMMKKSSEMKNIPIHSVRLPGLVAHQEVILGGIGQTLTIRHDSISRESFMPGVILAIKKIKGCNGLVYGLENIL
jgi:4-hydroxy-tetrahydrodipicolinate reductase